MYLYQLIRFIFRPCLWIFILLAGCWNASALSIELDIMFTDSARHYQYLCILDRNNDTLSISDSLAFNGTEGVSLFYQIAPEKEIKISATDTDNHSIESPFFKVSSRRTTFLVVFQDQYIDVSVKDFLYPIKGDKEESYLWFLLIFFVVKFIIALIYILANRIPASSLYIVAGVFILSSFISWLVPLNYIIRLGIVVLTEFTVIILFTWKKTSILHISLLVLINNLASFGLISFMYLLYTFW